MRDNNDDYSFAFGAASSRSKENPTLLEMIAFWAFIGCLALVSVAAGKYIWSKPIAPVYHVTIEDNDTTTTNQKVECGLASWNCRGDE